MMLDFIANFRHYYSRPPDIAMALTPKLDCVKFATKYPFLVQCSEVKYCGILYKNDDVVTIEIVFPNLPMLSGARLIMINPDGAHEYPMDCERDIYDFMDSFISLQDQSTCNSNPQSVPQFRNVLEQINPVKDRCTVQWSNDFRIVTLTDIPNHQRQFLKLEYSATSNTFRLMDHSLPDVCRNNLKGFTLTDYLDNFESELKSLEEFYGNISDIDELCFVIAGGHKDVYRIFKFNEKVFLKITMDPYVPSNVQLKFIGPSEEVSGLRQMYLQRIGDWDTEVGAYKNLLRMFDILFFPYRPTDSSWENKACGICYEVHLDGTYPIITCFNYNCQVVFHSTCLGKWFQTFANSKVFCTVASGECPYCTQKLSLYSEINM